MQLSIIIVNYNVRFFLEQALHAVRAASQGMEVETFVVDNDSKDDSLAMLAEKFPEVIVIANKDNVGFSVANNQAIRESKGKYVLLLNPDTVIEEDSLRCCYDFMEAHPTAGGLGVRMIDGSGAFLPESKRGFPTPWVSFCKTVGLHRFFPRSRTFNGYYLGHLGEMETNPVEVLAGAYMWLRRKTLDEIGLLDERFFMYGEDIDLSYRVTLGGYENYYLPETTIIHYKGESTKKGSLNYVRVFYQAMILFVQKHFSGKPGSGLYIGMLKLAIYLRATLTLLSNGVRQLTLPILDAALGVGGMIGLKAIWSRYRFADSDYYDETLLKINMPIYVTLWLLGIFFAGGYDRPIRPTSTTKGILLATLIIAAIYGFLPLEYRNSRALILLGAAWMIVSTLVIRWLLYGAGRSEQTARSLIVGTREESERVQLILKQAGAKREIIGTVAADQTSDTATYLGGLAQLDDIVRVYDTQEVIFCGRDVPAHRMMHWMNRLGPRIQYKMVAENSPSIIGSQDKNAAGELFTIDLRFNLAEPRLRRQKRVLDILLAGFVLLTGLFWALAYGEMPGLYRNAVQVLFGRKTWVGYAGADEQWRDLPKLKRGVLSPADELPPDMNHEATLRRLNLLYAKDYQVNRDVQLWWASRKAWGR